LKTLRTFRLLHWLMWLSIAVFVLDLLLIMGTRYLTGDRLTQEGTLVYPLLRHFYSRDFPSSEFILGLFGTVGIFIAFIRSRDRRALRPILLLLAVPLCLVIGGLTFGFIDTYFRPPPLTQLASVQSDGNVYQLVGDSCYVFYSGCTPSYLVFKCDSLSLVCHLFDIPYHEPEFTEQIEDAGTFRVDSGNHLLYVTIGGQEYPVVEHYSA
jgi:hypothetical protein